MGSLRKNKKSLSANNTGQRLKISAVPPELHTVHQPLPLFRMPQKSIRLLPCRRASTIRSSL